MDLKINSVNFGAKREIVYNLINAAKAARNAEYCTAAAYAHRPVNRSHESELYSAVMKTYIDSAVYDSSFNILIAEIGNDSNIIKTLAKILKPKQLQYSKINPLKRFKMAFVNPIAEHSKLSCQDKLERFFLKIENDKTL